VDAIECIASWASCESKRIECALLHDAATQQLVKIFEFHKIPSFSKALQPFLNLISVSSLLNYSLGSVNSNLIPMIMICTEQISDTFSTVKLLKILQSLLINAQEKHLIINAYRIGEFLKKISEKNDTVIVSQIVDQLLGIVDEALQKNRSV